MRRKKDDVAGNRARRRNVSLAHSFLRADDAADSEAACPVQIRTGIRINEKL